MSEQIIKTKHEQKMRMNDIKVLEAKEEENREKAKKNNNFVMMYREHMPEMRWLTNKSGKASNILNFIMEHMDYQNALMCSYQVFIDYFGFSQSTIMRSIKLLKENGFIDVLKSGTSNVYVVNQEIAWSSWDNQKQYCKFSGNVLISATENKDYEYRNQFEKFKTLRERENIKE
jgi:DNA-binding transcriptional ArsR family regulator